MGFTGTLEPGASYTSTLSDPLPAALPGNYRIIVRADIYNQVYEGNGEADNIAASSELVEVAVDELVLGVPHKTSLRAGEERLFQVAVPQDKTLAVTLGSQYELALHEVFLRYGSLPSSAAYDAVSGGGMDQVVTAVIPSTEPGIYYVLLRGHSAPADDGDVTVLAELVPLVITDVDTDAGGDGRYVTTTIRGAQFHEQAIIKLVRPGFGEYEPIDYRVIDSTKIVAIFDFTGAAHGLYDLKVINPGGGQAVVPYRFLIERAVAGEVTIGLGGPRIIDAGDVGRFSVALVNTGNLDAPYTFFEVGIPNFGINERVYNLPYARFSTNLRGDPRTPETQDVPWASLDPVLNTSHVAEKEGYLLAPGYLLNGHADGFTGFNFDVSTYPLLNELRSYDWDAIKGMAYAVFPDLAETDALHAGPRGLDQIVGGLYQIYLDGDIGVCPVPRHGAFQFPVVAAATTMTREELIEHATADSMRLREAVLADEHANPGLLAMAADAATWQQLYLESLVRAGVLRDEDQTPSAQENPRLISLIATLSAGILIGPAGNEVRTSGDLVDFFDQVRQWYGHDSDATVDLKMTPTCGPRCFGRSPLLTYPEQWAEFQAYDLELEQKTHFEAFRIYVPWGSIGHPKGRAAPDELTNYLSVPGEQSNLVLLEGPFAAETAGFLPMDQSLPFTVHFETDPEASTYVHEVRIVTQLDDELSVGSFRLGDLRIGDISVHIPEGRSVFQNDFDFIDARGFLLRVSAAIEPESRQAIWLLQAIDPLTGELLDDPNIGLLPPSGGTDRATGFVSYSVALSKDAETGARLDAQARVIMDNAPPEDTATLTYLVDARAPVTTLSVSALSSTEPNYQVAWNAVDEAGGSGVRHVTIHVATDGGDFQIWQRQRSEAAASEVFLGEAGHTYEFLAVATDVAGNRETPAFGTAVPDDGTTTHLGGTPVVPETTPPNFGAAPDPSPEPSTNPLFAEAAKGVPSALAHVRPAEYSDVLRPFVARAFATGIEQSHADIGPMALVEAPDGSILVSGGPARNLIYELDVTGGVTDEPLAQLDHPVFNMAFDLEGRLWATTGGGPLLQLDPDTGEILQRYADGITTGLAVEPGTDLIYVASSAGVEIFDPVAERFTHYSRDGNLRVGSLAFDATGTLWATTWPDREQVVRFTERARAETMLEFDAEVDSIAFGLTGTALEGLLFVSHVEGPRVAAGSAAHGGSELTLVDLATLQQLPVAEGGTRGDVVLATSDGRVLVSQSHQVDVIYPARAPLVVATSPADDAIAVLPLGSVSVTFDQPMYVGGPRHPASVTNVANYEIVGAETGHVAIESVVYDADTHSAILFPGRFEPDHYELRVLGSLANTDGPRLAEPYTTSLLAVSDFSQLVDIEFSNVRSDRAEETVSYDVKITNTGDYDLLLPVLLVLDPAHGYEGVPRDAAGQTPGGSWMIDLSEALPPGGSLLPGESTTGRTVVIDNAGNWHVAYEHGTYAVPTVNAPPQFDSEPVVEAEIGEPYVYEAAAHDPDGGIVVYMLHGGPEGMTVDPATGRIEWTPASVASAGTGVALHAYDSRGGRGVQQYVIDVTGGNRPPVLAALPEVVEIAEGQAWQVVLSAEDPDGDLLLAGADNLPPGARFNAAMNVLSWTPGYDAAGTYPDIRLSVSDGIHWVRTSLTILVLPTDQGPRLVNPAPRSVREGEQLRIYVKGEDPDGDAVRYFSNLLPPGASLNPNSGLFEWTPDFHQTGHYVFPISATSGGKNVTVEASITVLNVNGPPEFYPLEAWQGYEGDPIKFRPLALDPDNPGGLPPVRGQGDRLVPIGPGRSSLTYAADSLPAGAEFDPETATFLWEPGYDASGEYEISFTATDDGDGVGPVLARDLTTRLIVHNLNRSPEVAAVSNITIQQGETEQVTVQASDPDGNPLTLAASSALVGYRLPDFVGFVDNGDGTGGFTIAPGAGDRGEYAVALTATDDGDGGQSLPGTDEVSFVITVEAENDSPVIDHIGDKVAVVGIPFELLVAASDLDEETLTWDLSGLPAAASLQPGPTPMTRMLEWLPTFADVGTHMVGFEVSDGGNGNPALVATDTQNISLTVRQTNQPPVLVAPDDPTVSEGEMLALPISASDADGDVLTFSGENLPPGYSLDPQSGVLSWTPRHDQAGEYEGIVIHASDGHLSDSVTFAIEVTEANRPPLLEPMGRQLGAEGRLLQFNLAAVDADGDPLWYRASGSPVGAALNRQTGRFSWTPGYTDAGQYTITFEVVDPRGAADTREVLVEIENRNRAPSLSVTDHAVALGEVLEFDLLGDDPDPATSLTFAAEGLPEGASLDPVSGRFTWMPQPGQTGEHVVMFGVSDGEAVVSRAAVILVDLAPHPVRVSIELTPSYAVSPGDAVLVHVTADSLAAVDELGLTVDGTPLALDAQGRATMTAATPGKIRLEATAVDADGFVGRAATALKVLDPTDDQAPIVELSKRLARERMSDPFDVEGSIVDRNLNQWRLEMAWHGSGDFTEIAAGEMDMDGGALASVDPAQLCNGFYQLRLTARDMAGRTSVTESVIEINTASKPLGYRRVETDLEMELGETRIALTRAYDALARHGHGEFGHGWRLVPRDVDVQTNVELTGREHLGVYTALRGDTRLYLTLPSGERVAFSFVPEPVEVAGLTYYRPAWQPDHGVDYELHSVPAMLVRAGARFHDNETGQPYNPASPFFEGPDYTLAAPDGTQYEIETDRGVVAVTTPSGHRLLYSDAGITASTGESIQFVYDAAGRISRAMDFQGRTVVYSYDESGNLTGVRDLAGGWHSTYGYDVNDLHLLTAAVSSDGSGEAILYDGVARTEPIAAHLGGVAHFTGHVESGSLRAGETDRYTFALRDSEIASVGTGEVLMEVSIASGGLAPAPPVIAGLEPLPTPFDTGESLGLFALRHEGLYQVLVAGADDMASGSYEISVRVAGDVNGDGLVDGVDSALLAAAQGTVVGDPGFLPAADLDGSGTIDAQETSILSANYGFVANQSPAVNPELPDLLTHQDLPITVRLAEIVSDPDGDELQYRLTGAEHGAVSLSPDGRMALFMPEVGFVGSAAMRLVADDGGNASEELSLAVEVSDAPLLSIAIVDVASRVEAGDLTQVVVLGEFTDQADVPLVGGYVTFVSSDPSVATVSGSGRVRARSDGNTVLTVSRGVLQACTALQVGVPTDTESLYLMTTGLDVYPETLTLPPGETRQMLVRMSDGRALADAASGTRYVVGNSGILSVTEDGLVTALAEGSTTLSIFNGPAVETIPIRVVAAQAGPVDVGVEGGVFEGSDGSFVTIGPGALEAPITASIGPVAEEDLTPPLPTEYEYGAAFDLDLDGTTLGATAQLAVPVTGVEPGETVYFFREKLLTEGDGTQKEWWILVDRGIVGEDGMARTTSPPYPGFSEGGRYLCAKSDSPDFTISIPGLPASPLLTLFDNQASAYITVPPMGLGFFTSAAPWDVLHMAVAGWMSVVERYTVDYRVYPGDYTDQVPYFEQTVTCEVPPDVAHLEVAVDVPDMPRIAPMISQVEYHLIDEVPHVLVRGERMDTVEELVFRTMNGSDTWVETEFAGVTPTALAVPWPVESGMIMGLTEIQVRDRRGRPSNVGQLQPPGGLGFMTAYDDSGPFIATLESDIPEDANRMVAKLLLGEDGDKSIYSTVTSPDGTRLYAAVARGAAGDAWGGVAVVDTMTLRQVDDDLNTPGDNFIRLPGDADADSVAVAPQGDFLYVAEWGGAIHVVDIRPRSPRFHDVVETIQVVTDRDQNFSGAMAVSSDGRRLYVGIAGRRGGDGRIAVVNVDPADRPAGTSPDLSSTTDNPRYWHRVLGSFSTIHTPIQIVPTTHADKLAVTCAFKPYAFFALQVIDDRPDPTHFNIRLNSVNTDLYFPDIHLGRTSYNIDDAWSVAVMPDLSYAFVCDLNWSVFPRGIINPGANVGIVRDPFGLGEGPQLMAATTPIERGGANALALSPDGSRLFVSYSGIGEVLVMDTAVMIQAVETEPHRTFVFRPLDQLGDYDIHITPITFEGWAGGFSFQRPDEPPEAGLRDGTAFFTKDYSASSASAQNVYTITVPNLADPAESSAPMLVTIDVEVTPGDFLLDERGEPVATRFEWLVPPGTEKTLEMRAKPLLNAVASMTDDVIYGVKVHIQAFEQGLTGFTIPLDEATHYVYRYVDAMDATLTELDAAAYQAQNDPAHGDRILEMPDTVNDGTGGVVRVRELNVNAPVAANPQFDVVNEQHFRYESADSRFLFDPQSTGQNLQTEVIVKTPGDVEVGRLTLRGDGEMQEWYFDKNALKTALTNRVYNSSHAEITAAEKALVSPVVGPGGGASPQQDVVDLVFDQAKYFLLTNYQVALTDVASQTSNSVNFKTFVPSASSSATALGSAHLVDNVDLGPDGDFGTGDDIDYISNLIGHRTDVSDAQSYFLLSEALNEQRDGEVDIYVERYFTGANIQNLNQLVNVLAKTVVHELGHHLGLNHTFQWKGGQAEIVGSPTTTVFRGNPVDPARPLYSRDDIYGDWTIEFTSGTAALVGREFTVTNYVGSTREFTVTPALPVAPATGDIFWVERRFTISPENATNPIDIMAQGLDWDATRRFNITDGALRVALGMSWDDPSHATTPENAYPRHGLDYFERYVNRIQPDVWGDAGPYGDDDDWSAGGGLGGVLRVLSAEDGNFLREVDFGQVVVDGTGGDAAQWQLLVANIGDEDLTVHAFGMPDAASGFVVGELPPDTVIPPRGSLPVTVTFDPLTSGHAAATWTVYTSAMNSRLAVNLAGIGHSLGPDLIIDAANNNLGGAMVLDEAVRADDIITLTNQGAQPLSIHDVVAGEGKEAFVVEGLPAGTSFANPLVLQPGESRTLNVLFRPDQPGLRRGLVHVFSNDPYQPRRSCTVVGTGLTGTGASLGNDYVAIRRPGAPVRRVMSDSFCTFSLDAGPGTPYSYVAFDPDTGLVSHQSGTTDIRGRMAFGTAPLFYASIEPDSDGDGLPDDVEFAIGSRVDAADSNGDRLDDFQSLAQGIHPGEPSSRKDSGATIDEFGFGLTGWPVTLAGGAGSPITADAGGLDPESLEPLVAAATASWSTAGADPDGLAAMRFEVVDLPGLALGRTVRVAQDEYVVSIDVDGGGYGWFVDQTPETAEEFIGEANGQFVAGSTSGAFGAVDLLTVVTHEVGHVLGLADRPGSDSLIMSALLPLGVRRVPTATDLEGPQLDQNLTDFGWYNGAEPPGDPHELINGDFSVRDPGSSEFGWSLRGDASVVDEQGVLGETGPLNAGIAQTFLVPDGARYLRFDVVELDLYATGSDPPDAFEVALLDPVTMSPLVGPAEGLSETDALLNVQATGEIFFAPGVNLPFLATSGEQLDAAYPFTVEIVLPEMDAGTQASLYFDLLGFADDNSSVRLDNVLLSETPLLALSLELDPATDSGDIGDALTNFSIVNLLGKTQPGMEVQLALDGDGFDDGVVTSDAAGMFVFEDVTLAPGENLLGTRVTRGEESLTAQLTVTLDTQPPTATLVSPAGGSTVTSISGWIDLQWSDGGAAGLDATTFDTGDVSISGVTIDEVEIRDDGVVRYLYGQDGDQLALGTVVVTTHAGEVADLAANPNAAQAFSFVLEESAVEVPPVVDLNGGADGIDVAVTYVEGSGPLGIVAADMTVSDEDSAQLSSATVTLANLVDAGEELLAVETAGTSIVATYDRSSGVLLLVGSDTLAHYEQALRTLTYENASQDPDATSRCVEVTVSDGALSSVVAVATIDVMPENDRPLVDLNGDDPDTGFTSTFTEDGDAVAVVAPEMTVTDVDSAALSSATVTLTNLLDGVDEILAVDTAGTSITASYDGSSGVLSLAGTDTVGHYEQVLRTLTYENTSQAPDATSRCVEVTVSDGALSSVVAVATIDVMPENDRPLVDLNGDDPDTGFTSTFTEDGDAVAVVAPGMTVTDVDSAELSSATVTLTNLLDGVDEVLAVDTAGTSITASYDGSSGVLSLAGTDTVGHYEQVLRTLTYENTSQDPDPTSRTVEVIVSDGALSSETAVAAVEVVPVNDAPAVDLNGDDPDTGFTSTFTEDGGAVAVVAPDMTVMDVDSAEFSSATVTLTNLLDGVHETLAVEMAGTSITASYDESSGELFLRGPDTVGHYEQVLRTLTYEHASEDPNATPRTVEVVVSDGELSSVVAVATIDVMPVNDRPVVDLNGPEAAGTGFASTFTEGFGAVSIVGSTLSIRDVDSEALVSGSVMITNRRDGASEVLLVDTGDTGISAAYDASQGVLTLSGTAPLSSYEDVFRTLRYENSSWDPDRETRRIEVVVSDGTSDSEAAVSSVEVIASTHGISGYVYVDVNNDGIKGAPEMALPNVPVRLEGPVSRVVLTGADGGYYFGNLPSGRYSVHETQPMAFMDGRETAGGPVDCEMGEDEFYDLELRGPDTHAAGYNFGERGLRAELVTKQLFLSSSPSGDEMLRQLDVVGGNGWYPFVAAHDASVTVDLGSGVEEPLIEIYGEGWLPVRLSSGERAATAEVEEGESYVFYVSGGGLEIVSVSVRLDRSGVYTNPADALDVSADGYVSPIDALLVIQTLNDRGSRLIVGPSQEPPYVDVNGDGYVSPIDVLWIIDHLNEPDEPPVAGLSDTGEGESVVLASGRVGETAHCMGVGDAAREVGLVSAVVEKRVSTARTAGIVVGVWGAGAEREMGDAGLVTARDAMLGVQATRGDGRPAAFAVSRESWSMAGERDAWWSGGVGREAWLSLGLDEMVVDHGGRAGRRDSDESEGEECLLSSDLESLLTDLAEDVVRRKRSQGGFLR